MLIEADSAPAPFGWDAFPMDTGAAELARDDLPGGRGTGVRQPGRASTPWDHKGERSYAVGASGGVEPLRDHRIVAADRMAGGSAAALRAEA
jgi:hypothetical protein